MHLHQSSAFPIASFTVALCTFEPDLTRILLAHFHSSCPFTVPYYMPKAEGQSTQDYKLAVGYLKKASNPDGLETEEAFYERMAGMIALYAAITQTDPLPGTRIP